MRCQRHQQRHNPLCYNTSFKFSAATKDVKILLFTSQTQLLWIRWTIILYTNTFSLYFRDSIIRKQNRQNQNENGPYQEAKELVIPTWAQEGNGVVGELLCKLRFAWNRYCNIISKAIALGAGIPQGANSSPSCSIFYLAPQESSSRWPKCLDAWIHVEDPEEYAGFSLAWPDWKSRWMDLHLSLPFSGLEHGGRKQVTYKSLCFHFPTRMNLG